MKKKTKKKNNVVYNVLAYVIVIIILAMSVVCINLISTIQYSKFEGKIIDNFDESILNTKIKYDTSKLSFIDISVFEEPSELMTTCINGCNLQVKDFAKDYKFIIKKENNKHYSFDLVYNDRAIVRDKSLGDSTDFLLIFKQDNNIILTNKIVLKMINKDLTSDEYRYDYAFVVNDNYETDEFSSLFEDELKVTTEGIVYSYDVCEANEGTNAKRIVAKRKPFSKKAEVLETSNINLSWC